MFSVVCEVLYQRQENRVATYSDFCEKAFKASHSIPLLPDQAE